MNNSHFTFKPHLETAHQTWSALLSKEDLVIDATCGKGYDTIQLAKLAHLVHALDIQEEAIEKTKQKAQELHLENIHYHQRCHSSFPSEISPGSIKLVVYNLGYLPGGDKEITTMTSTTLQSLNQACTLLKQSGMISIMCYPGHQEGKKEEGEILEWATNLDQALWRCCHHRWINKEKSPSLLFITKINFS